MWAHHEGARHWLDWGYGIDSIMCLMSGVKVSGQSVFG